MKLIFSIIFLMCVQNLFSQILPNLAKSLDGNSGEVGRTIDTDNSGNIFVGGIFQDTIDIDPGTDTLYLVASGSYDFFIAKYSPIGDLIWGFKVGGSNFDYINELKIDQGGNVIIVGRYRSSVDFDPSTGVSIPSSAGIENGFLAKYDSFGQFLWIIPFQGSGFDEAMSVDIDNNNDIFVTGAFNGTVDFDPSGSIFSLTSSNKDIFFVKYTSTGALLFAKAISGIANEEGRSIRLNSSEEIILSGTFESTCDFDPTIMVNNLTSTSASDAFVAKYNSNGDLIWVNQIAGLSNEDIYIATCDSLNNILIAGNFQDSIDFNFSLPGFDLDAQAWDIFIAKYNDSGTILWSKKIGGTGTNRCFNNAIQIDKDNFIYLSGYIMGNCDFDPSPAIVIESSLLSSEDAFIARYDANGEFVWVKILENSPNSDCVFSSHLDKFSNLYLTGYFSGPIDIDISPDTSTLNNYMFQDVFILKYTQDPCINLYAIVDTVLSISCVSDGFAIVHAVGGLAPYTYTWNTIPITNDSICSFTTSGIYEITVTDSNDCYYKRDFLIMTPDTIGYDLVAKLSIDGDIRPGFGSQIWLNGFNKTCNSVSGYLRLILDSNSVYQGASIIPNLISGDTLIWNFNNLRYDTAHLIPIVDILTLSTTPLGTSVCFQLNIFPDSLDIDPNNNQGIYCYTAIGSYDPNDKQVYPQGVNVNRGILNNQDMTYTVRFQNTGTAPAINVYILDTLDADLDLNSVRIVASSHYMFTEVLPGNVLKFHFDNINLPDSSSDEPNSHGYVIYEIDQLPNLPHNTLIENTAAIYFDYNEPVITNTVFNTIDLGATITASANNFCCADSSLLTLVPNVPGLQGNWQWFENICSGTPIGNGSSIWVYPSATTNYFVKDSSGTICFSHTINVTNLDNSVNQSVITLASNQSTGTYQWLNCDSAYAPVSGETGQVFTATMNGNYAVIISDNGCVDTSACYLINSVGILSQLNGNLINVYPNPVNTQLNISFSSGVNDMSVSLLNVAGQVLIQRSDLSGNNFTLLTNDLAAGVYYLKISESEKNVTIKVIKQ